MKTAISIPDATFARAERHAAALGMSRSQFYVSAIERYMETLMDDSITKHINDALDLIGDSEDQLIAEVTAHAMRQLALADDEDW